MHDTTACPSPARPSGADVVLDILRDEGVGYIFGNPGTTELPLLQALENHPDLSYVLALQEASAVGMADGYARISGRPAVVNLHAAAGLGHAIGALTNAAAARVPLVITAGQQDLRHLFHNPVLAGDLAGLARPTVKWSHQASTRDDVGEAVRRAFHIATTPPTGPVFLALPMNLLDEQGAPPPPRIPTSPPSAAPIEQLMPLLRRERAGSTALVYGDELAYAAPAEGVALAETLGADVWGPGWPAANPFPTAHTRWRGFLPTHVAGIRDTLASYRTVLIVGTHVFDRYYPYEAGPILPEGVTSIQITADANALGLSAPLDLALHGDLKPTLTALISALGNSEAPASTVAEAATTHGEAAGGEGSSALNCTTLADVLDDWLAPDIVVVDEAPQAARHLRAAMHLAPKQYQWVAGGLGWAMPAAVGASLARNRGRVLCTLGDGAAMYSPQALWTAAQLRLPVTYVVANNQEYNVLKANWRHRNPEATGFIGLDLREPALDFSALATAMGVASHRAETLDGLRDILREPSTGPRLIDVALPPDN
ncbi:thiamine pyrophosphate-binding protein [Streptomyces atriruber]|uniref:thiamine pyrophosphate-binding protein n=1 Tax=Streptomyces atriruber TaxID=545121 RepID=UPI0006E33786|nr:thiamine pyrophosphate-binding protein [Streptomyces atriruber]